MLKKLQNLELFQPPRPYLGEPPTVAGFLLYPDAPTKMETTSQEAFCFRPSCYEVKGSKGCDDPRGEHSAQKLLRESTCSSLTSSRQTGRGSSSSRNTKGEQGGTDYCRGPTEMKSLYQKDFPPPSLCRRRTPAAPQPDNIGINPALRFEFSTVQRETYRPF
ncbi:uncharacterized protein ACB058_016521 isoform 1-T2 [Synchiropus picturatus]